MSFVVQTCGHPTSDLAYPLIRISSIDGDHYFIGSTAEGIQRQLTENSVRFHSCKGLFLTGLVSWDRLGGLPGFLMTSSDRGMKKFDLYYGNGLINYFVSTWKYFVFRYGLDFNCKPIDSNKNVYKDKNLIIKGFQIGNFEANNDQYSLVEKFNEIIKKMFPFDIKANEKNEAETLSIQQLANASDPVIESDYIKTKTPDIPQSLKNSRGSVSTNYYIEFANIRGFFNAKKAKDSGVPAGPLFRKLANGEDIVLDNGTTIYAKDILSAPRKIKNILVFDIFSEAHLEETCEYVSKNVSTWERVGLIYYFLDNSIGEKKTKFKSLIELFDETFSNVNHIVSNRKFCPDTINFEEGLKLIIKLKSLDLDQYRLPTMKITPRITIHKPNVIPLFNNQKFILTKGESVEYQESDSLVVNENIKTETDYFSELYDQSIKSLEVNSLKIAPFESIMKDSTIEFLYKEKYIHKLTGDFSFLKDKVQVITLGTGSALPSVLRNVSGNLIRIPVLTQKSKQIRYFSVILDAGENTLGSLRRIFSITELQQYFQKQLKLIYLSHLHADHHLGIVSLIEEWVKHNKETEEELIILAPRQYKFFLQEVSSINTAIDCSKIKIYDNFHFTDLATSDSRYQNNPGFKTHILKMREEIYKKLNINEIKTTFAHHCPNAFAVSISFNLLNSGDVSEQFRISYSGDTRPIEQFAEMGKDSDLLIHEATFENELRNEAIAKSHSTVGEAINIGRLMKAKKIILTHFSQRYTSSCLSLHQEQAVSKKEEVNLGEGINADLERLIVDLAFDSKIMSYKDIGENTEEINELLKLLDDKKEEIKKKNLAAIHEEDEQRKKQKLNQKKEEKKKKEVE